MLRNLEHGRSLQNLTRCRMLKNSQQDLTGSSTLPVPCDPEASLRTQTRLPCQHNTEEEINLCPQSCPAPQHPPRMTDYITVMRCDHSFHIDPSTYSKGLPHHFFFLLLEYGKGRLGVLLSIHLHRLRPSQAQCHRNHPA